MIQTTLPAQEGAILTRIVEGDGHELSPAAAKGILTLTFGQTDKTRMQLLACKAKDGELTIAEEREVEAYSRISSLLGILKSKARRALKHRQISGQAKRQ
jgi:hypothetical protein